jgi:competence protein ComEC
VLAVHAPESFPPLWLLCVLTLPALVPWAGRAVWAAFVFGVLFCIWRVGDDLDRQWPASRHREEIELIGTIASLPEPVAARSERPGESSWRFRFEPADRSMPVMRVGWYDADVIPKAGECWTLELAMRTPHGSLNPATFDYEGWLFRQGIGALATVRSGERCETSDAAPWLVLRQRILDRMTEQLPEHPGVPLLAALTIGDTGRIRDDQWRIFRWTGTTHLVAISGFNVAIVSGLAFLLGRWVWCLWPPLCLRLPAQKAGMLAAAGVGLAYAFVAGWEPPVQRASLMLGLLLIAAWFDRLQRPAQLLALALIAVLLIDPEAALSPGLWLSFAAVALIFYLSRQRLGPGPFWVEALRIQAGLTLGLLPMSLGWFSGLSWAALPINLIAVPIVAVVTPLALLAIVLDAIWPSVGVVALGLVASALAGLQEGLDGLSAPALQGWWAARPGIPALLLAALGVVLVLSPRGLPLKPLGLLCLLPLLFPRAWSVERGFEVAMLDVGQGLSVIVRTAQHTMIYDTGPAFEDGFDAGESVVVPYLLGRGVNRVDRLVISHDDRDHAGGMEAVQRYLRIDDALGARTSRACRDGMAWDWDGVNFRVLHPDDAAWSDNNGSCVILVSDGKRRLLLTGDIEHVAEQRLLKAHADDLHADLLIAPHHGSRSSSSEALVAAVHPSIVFYGAAWRSHFRHPNPEVVARYAESGARQFTTGVSGALSAVPSDSGWMVDEYRPQARHWWNALAEP